MTIEPSWPFYTAPSHIDVAGLDVAYRRQGSGPVVLYLHGAGLTRRWLPFYAALARSVDLIVPEHPGFGDTPMPSWLDGFDDVILHYADLLDAFDIGTVHVVGQSFGAWIAAEFAVFFPERVRSLQLITPAGLRGSELHDPYRQTGEEALERVFNGHGLDYPEYIDDGDLTEAMVHDYLELTTRARLAWNPRYGPKLERRLYRMKSPTQVILADDDRVISNEVAERYAHGISGARVVGIVGESTPTSHVPFVQEPEKLAALITDFVSRCEGAIDATGA